MNLFPFFRPFVFNRLRTLLQLGGGGGWGPHFHYSPTPLLPPFPEWNVALAFPATPPKTPVEWNVAQGGIASEERT
jgi:hypothetical protein